MTDLVAAAYADPLNVSAVLALASADARAAGNGDWANRLLDAKAAHDDLVRVAKHIQYADRTGNNGAANGEAVLCRSYATQLKMALLGAGADI